MHGTFSRRTESSGLERLLNGQDLLLPARRLADDRLKAWAQVLERGYEGSGG
jgi:hypothetical protein